MRYFPKTAIGRFLREMGHRGYLESKDREVAEMQEYYDLYLQSYQVVGGIICDMREHENC